MPRENGTFRLKVIGKGGRKEVNLHLNRRLNIEPTGKVFCGSGYLTAFRGPLPIQLEEIVF